eukprot:TRINITY_DN10765_c0_g1_i1.p1 TRINITY_DN10765_c0_g1~~TRINITY_DN10765_c0_g1_i1.p1  ORF type:complete len:183 (+),score=18.11 TRINITY_DN10765_c0_g1_i1:285-833(+)
MSKYLTAEEERAKVKDIIELVTSTSYVVPAKWFRYWKDYTRFEGGYGYPTQKPGFVDTRALLLGSELKSSLVEGIDYYIVNEKVWNYFNAWYVTGPAIPVYLNSSGSSTGQSTETSDSKEKANIRTDLCLCLECKSKPRDTVIMPCLHLSFCSACILEKFMKDRVCPVCSQKVASLLPCKLE